MTTDKVPEAAVEAADAALKDYLDNFPGWKPQGEAEVLLEAAYPHIRRAVIEELIAKYEAKRDSQGITASQRLHTYDSGATVRVLRAELEGDDRG